MSLTSLFTPVAWRGAKRNVIIFQAIVDGARMSDVAKLFGISNQRVCQIFNREWEKMALPKRPHAMATAAYVRRVFHERKMFTSNDPALDL